MSKANKAPTIILLGAMEYKLIEVNYLLDGDSCYKQKYNRVRDRVTRLEGSFLLFYVDSEVTCQQRHKWREE